MEYLTKIINEASLKLGSQKAVEDYLELAPRYLTEVKGGRRGLPDIAQAKLEELMQLKEGSLRAPSAIITETKPERRAFWQKKLEALAATVLVTVVTTVATPFPAEASSYRILGADTVYIM